MCCELGNIIVLYVSCTSNKQKKTNSVKKKSDLWLPKIGVRGEEIG